MHETPLLCKAHLCSALQCCAWRLAQVYLSQGKSKITLSVSQAGHRAGRHHSLVGSTPESLDAAAAWYILKKP